MQTIKEKNMDSSTNLVEEKTNILKKSIESIELGLGEAQVYPTLFISINYVLYTVVQKS